MRTNDPVKDNPPNDMVLTRDNGITLGNHQNLFPDRVDRSLLRHDEQ